MHEEDKLLAHVRKSITSCRQAPTQKKIKRRRHLNTNATLPNASEANASIGKTDQQYEFCGALNWPGECDGQAHQDRSDCRHLTTPQFHSLS